MVKKEQFVTATGCNHKHSFRYWMHNHTRLRHIVTLRFYVRRHKKAALLRFRKLKGFEGQRWQIEHHGGWAPGDTILACQKHLPANFLWGKTAQGNWIWSKPKTIGLTNDMVNLVYYSQMAIFTTVRQLIRHKSTRREIWKLYKGVKLCFCVEASEKLIISAAGCLKNTARERFN